MQAAVHSLTLDDLKIAFTVDNRDTLHQHQQRFAQILNQVRACLDDELCRKHGDELVVPLYVSRPDLWTIIPRLNLQYFSESASDRPPKKYTHPGAGGIEFASK